MPEDEKVFRRLMAHLGIELVSLPFECCGNPARGDHFEASMFAALKNLALAEQEGLDILTPCKCCFGQFKHAVYWYAQLPELKIHVDQLLSRTHLRWQGSIRVFHTLNMLHEKIGFEQVQKMIVNPLEGRKMVVQHGCHAYRPHAMTQFDHPGRTGMFEQVLKIAGIQVQDWSGSSVCCANPIQETSPELAEKIMQRKLDSASRTGADSICMACTHCRMQYKTLDHTPEINPHHLTAEWFPQILAHAMGIIRR